MPELRTHYRADKNIGICGYFGKNTRDKKKVTCKLCKRLIKAGKHLDFM